MNNRSHTFASIAESLGCEPRTVRNWWDKEKSQGAELGEIIEGTRRFTDAERDRLLQHRSIRLKKPESSSATDFIQPTEAAIVQRVEIELPEQFNPTLAAAKFDGVVGQATDPDQIVALAQMMLGAANQSLDSKIEQQRQELDRHEQAKKQLEEIKQNGITDLKLKALESKLLAKEQTSKTSDLQSLLADIAALGKSSSDGSPGS